MGANEKHTATYHGLSDDTVRGRYCDGTHAQTGHTTGGAEYDTWLAGVKAEAKAEALIEYADAIQHIDDVIHRYAEPDDRWTDFQDAERDFNRNDEDKVRDYYTATTHYARTRAQQLRNNID